MKNEVENFKAAMLAAGVNAPNAIIPDGKLHRFKIDGKLNGWYVLHLDGRAAGSFGDWKQGINEKWKLFGKFKKFTAAEKAEFKKQRQISEATQKAELEAQYKSVADKARYIYDNAQPVTNHPYLILKNIKAHGARIARDGRMVIPLFNTNNEIVNVQFIDDAGVKRFLKDGQKKGCFFVIGGKSERLCIAEGFATAASIYEHTKQQTFVAFDAGNLEQVAKAIRKRNPKDEIVIMSDNDQLTDEDKARGFTVGIGQRCAQAAAAASGGKILYCPITGMDFNDYLNSNSGAAV